MAMAKKPSTAKSGIPFSAKLAILMVMVCAVVLLPATLIFVITMLPTFVAMIVDRQPEKTMWLTIGALNLAGAMPSWFKLWGMGGQMQDAVVIISDTSVLLLAYGAAGAGWVIHQNVTPLIAALIVKRNDIRLKDIDKKQKELARKWGADIAKMG